MALTFNRILLAKVESPYGTSSGPVGTADVIRIGNDLELKPLMMELVDRDILYPWVGNRPQLATQTMAGISFSFEISGSGAAGTAPRTSPLWLCSGHGETIIGATSVTYAPIGTGYQGATINCRHDGKQHLITGVRGNITLDFKSNAVPTAKFDGMGFYNTPSDVANPSLTFANQADPTVVNYLNTPTVSVHGYNACMESFSFDCGRAPKLHQRAGCTRQVRIDTERAPSGEIVIEAPTITAKDYFTPAAAQTQAQINFTHGITAGNIFTFTAPTASLGDPAYGDADGVELLTLPFMPIPTVAGAGLNDYTIAFT